MFRCFAPLPSGCCFAFVRARLRHVFCLRTVALFSSFRGSKGVTSAPCGHAGFLLRLRSDLGGVWLFRIHCQAAAVSRLRHVFGLGTGAAFFSCRGSKGATSALAFVQARLRHVFCLRTGALFFSFRRSKGATSHPCE